MKLNTEGLSEKQLKAIRMTSRGSLLAPALAHAEFDQLAARGWFEPRGLGGFKLTPEGRMAAARSRAWAALVGGQGAL